MLSDVDIMIRVQAGETSLFTELVQRYQTRLLRFARSKLVNRSDAEDLVQEAFLAAYHSRNSYSPAFEFSTWIWTITLNLARRANLKRSRTIHREREFSKLKAITSGLEQPFHSLMEAEQSETLDRWLSMIPEPQADAIRLKFFGELKYSEIALTMDCSESGAKRRVKMGLLKLADLADSETNDS
ncbi:RNA polymerase sigma factor [Thalassoglobus polymorphus]|uniref:RNA polymerase sigma factor n=1 Tax=Thalassoglobus polymorphus TaxID=2527994 RepID=A0A517QQG4_9PLAN|nr:RNA polymerase sigma factor [Thalassoglobus polymorphus]QDT33890.1 ECF RNA polymerase sigma-E factor [Thalassoglobus polymorphus]